MATTLLVSPNGIVRMTIASVFSAGMAGPIDRSRWSPRWGREANGGHHRPLAPAHSAPLAWSEVVVACQVQEAVEGVIRQFLPRLPVEFLRHASGRLDADDDVAGEPPGRFAPEISSRLAPETRELAEPLDSAQTKAVAGLRVVNLTWGGEAETGKQPGSVQAAARL